MFLEWLEAAHCNERLGKDLHSWIKEQPIFTEQTAKGVAKKLLQAMQLMHSQGVVHRDLKPINILFKVGDFQ
jgi:serine/threonine protein kinase